MILIRRKARSTGTTVSLEDMGADYPDGRYMTVCDTHGGCVCHPTRKLAEQWVSHPEDWCPTCLMRKRKRMTTKTDWNLKDLPPNWTVDDIEARAPEHIRKIERTYRLTLSMPEHTDGYEPEFFIKLDMNDKDALKKKLQALIDRPHSRVASYRLDDIPVARASFCDTIIKTLEKEK